MTDADAAAEQAAVAVIRAPPARRRDRRRGGHRPRRRGRRPPLVRRRDRRHGRFANGLPGGWCSAVALEDEHGAKRRPPSRTRSASSTPPRAATARRCNGEPIHLRDPRPLEQAHVALFLRQDRLVKPGVRESGHALLDRAGLFRHAGPGTLELAWVAAGRLDAWVQPETDPWDWLPGALLVTEAGGVAMVVEKQTRWHLAGPSALVDALVSLLT